MRYKATFDPQAWVNDYAVPVDPAGETRWDCSEFVSKLSEAKKSEIAAAMSAGVGSVWLDIDDILKDDPAAPEWVREWQGPFTITVEAIR